MIRIIKREKFFRHVTKLCCISHQNDVPLNSNSILTPIHTVHLSFDHGWQALANSGLAKRVASSAEAYHDVMLQYATEERSTEQSETF